MSLFRIGVYDKNRLFRCQIGSPSALSATVRHGLTSTLTMTAPTSHERFGELMADGARLKVSFKGKHLISGPIVADEGETDGVTGFATFTVEDDFRILRKILGWQVPGSPISDQSAAEYRTYTGDAETIIKTAVTENGVNRLAIPGLVVAPNLHRGAVVPGGVPFRMHSLMDKMFPALEQAGIGVTVQQVGSDLVLDVYEPRVFGKKLSAAGRTLKKTKWNRTRPESSRVVIGGQGEGTARKFRVVTDPARESQYGMVAETFRDARDDNTDSVMDARGQETLTDDGPKNGLSLELAGTGIFQYGPDGFEVGDQVPVDIGNGQIITETIREAKITWVSEDYASVEPSIGELTNQPARIIAQRLAALGKGQRNQERN
ncbi:minor tail protein [Arthrobacter phage Kumotta]|uniref:Minor tail protein n=2 Tax=Kumottavirus TaxID=3044749 RepID=A0A4Y6EUD6_9CAUD|nr:minor tail protein [Arthrobacter phage Kumotta]YP_010649501.1 minor tail protein [Arthrobacter phage MargaretKali]AXH44399.1 minor tail protein [Arthrobacter phage MargaretKali]QDF19529.1 minor tail protein [Arthrobacter phage Kumotta]